jgi:hypothetical protein
MIETQMIDGKKCHPDRSAAEWRDLLFALVSSHASRFSRETALHEISQFPVTGKIAPNGV